MSDRDITWVCSHCSARLCTRAALTAHVASEHGRRRPASPPSHDFVKPTVAAFPVEPTAKAPWQPEAASSPQPEPRTSADAVRGGPPVAPTVLAVRPASHSTPRKLNWLLVAVLCVAAVGLGLGIAFRHQIAPALTREPTPFTQLYFSDPDGLPRTLRVSRPNRFEFTVVNREGRASAYSYVVTLASSHGSSTVARGRIDLRNNKAATVEIDVRPTRRATEYSIAVGLVGRDKTIQFGAVSD